MEEKISKQSIDRLDIRDVAIKILNNNNIRNIGQLCRKTRKTLKEIGIEQFDINKIDIELQLLGLSLKGSL